MALVGSTVRESVALLPTMACALAATVKSATATMTLTVYVPRMLEPSVVVAVMVTVPALTPVTVAVLPFSLFATVATEALEDVQVKSCATSSVVPFLP